MTIFEAIKTDCLEAISFEVFILFILVFVVKRVIDRMVFKGE
jgi:hypothetical protein